MKAWHNYRLLDPDKNTVRIDLESFYFGRNHYTNYPCALLVISSSPIQTEGESTSAGSSVQYLDRKLCGARCMQVWAGFKQPQPVAATITAALKSNHADDSDFTAQLALAVTKTILEFIGAPPKRIEIVPEPS